MGIGCCLELSGCKGVTASAPLCLTDAGSERPAVWSNTGPQFKCPLGRDDN